MCSKIYAVPTLHIKNIVDVGLCRCMTHSTCRMYDYIELYYFFKLLLISMCQHSCCVYINFCIRASLVVILGFVFIEG